MIRLIPIFFFFTNDSMCERLIKIYIYIFVLDRVFINDFIEKSQRAFFIMRLRISEPKMPSHLLSASKAFPEMGKFGRNKIKGKRNIY